MDNLVQYRLENAQEKLESAEILLNAGKYKDSIGPSYYAIFSAVRTILALDHVDFSKHAGVIAYFQKEYIKTKKFDTKFSKYLQNAPYQWRKGVRYLSCLAEDKTSGFLTITSCSAQGPIYLLL